MLSKAFQRNFINENAVVSRIFFPFTFLARSSEFAVFVTKSWVSRDAHKRKTPFHHATNKHFFVDPVTSWVSTFKLTNSVSETLNSALTNPYKFEENQIWLSLETFNKNMKFSTAVVVSLVATLSAIAPITNAQNTMVKMCLFYPNPSGHARSDPIINQNCASGHVHTVSLFAFRQVYYICFFQSYVSSFCTVLRSSKLSSKYKLSRSYWHACSI